jgi:two-component system, OmpR family, response regulator MprA
MSVLVVDDEPALRKALERVLVANGFDVATAADAEEALALLHARTFDALVLDLVLPGRDGIDVCQILRRQGSELPILMLTARDTIRDRVVGLEAGADDYLAKPFANDELIARIRALLRRAGSHGERLSFGELELDVPTRETRRGGRSISLSRTEFELLELFMRHPRQVLSRSQIYERIWGYDASFTSNSLDVILGHLRRKLEADGEPRLIHTVRGVGFVLRAP